MKMQEKMRLFFFSLFLVALSTSTLAKPKTNWDFYSAYGERSPKWDPLVKAGFEAFEAENPETAIRFLERAKILGCRDGLVTLQVALYKESRGNIKGAITLLQEAEPSLKKRYSKIKETQVLPEHLGRLYYHLGDYKKALPRFLEAIQIQGENFLRLFLVGQMHRMDGNSKEATTYFEKALFFEPEADPTMPPPQYWKILAQTELMKLHFDNANHERALELAEQILEMDPSNITASSYKDNIIKARMKQNEKKSWEKILNN